MKPLNEYVIALPGLEWSFSYEDSAREFKLNYLVYFTVDLS